MSAKNVFTLSNQYILSSQDEGVKTTHESLGNARSGMDVHKISEAETLSEEHPGMLSSIDKSKPKWTFEP